MAGQGLSRLAEFCPVDAIDSQLFGVLAENAAEALLALVPSDGRVLTVNRRFAELVGATRQEIIGRPAHELLAKTSVPIEQLLARAGLHEDVVLQAADGYPVFVSVSVSMVEHEVGPLCVCVVRDTTERRLLEREVLAKHVALFAAHAELERAVANLEERNSELAILGAQLSQAARRALIGELSAGIAHSLNNPLAALASTQQKILQVVEAQGQGEIVDVVRRLSARSATAIDRMERIVQSIQRAHRSGAMSSDPRGVAVVDEIETALALFDARLRRVRVEKRFSGDTLAWLPPGDLQHVLWNLLDNALLAMSQAGEPEGALTIEVASENGELRIVIADSGPGISSELMPTLFQPFNSTRREGSGLGLSTARRLARGWGGDVTLLPTKQGERGATFEIRLPTKESACVAAC